MNKTSLQAKVEARNIANAAVLEYTPRILAALRPLVGEIMKTQDGAYSAKLRKAMAALDLPNMGAGLPRVQCIIRPQSYWFRAEFHVCVACENGSRTDTVAVNLGEMNGHTLKSVEDAPTPACFPTDFTAESILSARAAVEHLQDELRAAERKLCFFGMSDN